MKGLNLHRFCFSVAHKKGPPVGGPKVACRRCYCGLLDMIVELLQLIVRGQLGNCY